MKRREYDKYANRKKDDDGIHIISFELDEKRKQQKQKKQSVRNKEFVRVTYLFVALFLAMMGYLVYFNTVRSKEIINSPYNVRLDSMADRIVRGKIFDRSGNVLAETQVNDDGIEKRIYPYGTLFAHVVGYDTHGKAGIESVNNFELLTSHAFFPEKIKNELKGAKNIGDNIVTTLDVDIQKAASAALGSHNGAVVVMEVATGKIVAMVSKPDFNPNKVSVNWDDLSTSEESVLLNRAMQGAYAPGSVFKLVTTLAYMRDNQNYKNYKYYCEGEIEHNGTVIHCAQNRVHKEEDLASSFANSCNASYSNIGLTLRYGKFKNTAEDLLFDTELPALLPYTQSKFRLTRASDDAEIMMTAIGQGKTQVSPYHMVLVASAIANGGNLMKPYLVSQITNYTGATVDKIMPEKYGRLISSKEASQLKTYMQGVVENGTGSALSGESYTVAGKTGTAEYSSDKDRTHSWFMGFSNVENPELAISVIVEGADRSGMSAVTVAKKVFNAYYY